MSASQSIIMKAFCADCGGARNCTVQASHRQSGNDGQGYYNWTIDWYILQCNGCDYTFMQHDSSDSEDVNHYYDEAGDEQLDYVVRTETWPAINKREKPEWLTITGIEGNTNDALDAVILELYRALNADLNILSGIGARTCFEIASEILGVDPDLAFKDKIKQLVADNHIRDNEKDHIEVLVEAGHGAAHRKWKPSASEINTVMGILESFLFECLVKSARKAGNDKNVATLKNSIPPGRKKRAKIPSDKGPAS